MFEMRASAFSLARLCGMLQRQPILALATTAGFDALEDPVCRLVSHTTQCENGLRIAQRNAAKPIA